jgi:hypothetical protein
MLLTGDSGGLSGLATAIGEKVERTKQAQSQDLIRCIVFQPDSQGFLLNLSYPKHAHLGLDTAIFFEKSPILDFGGRRDGY